jgi:prevent-host-death family protein
MEKAIGIRKLRDELTRHLGRVRRGGRVVITHRGQPVALLLPYARRAQLSGTRRLEALLSGGHVLPAERRFLSEPPLAKGQGALLSDIVGESRR